MVLNCETFSITGSSRMTFSKTLFNSVVFFWKTFRRMNFSRIAFMLMIFIRMAFSRMAFSRMTFIRMAFSRISFSRMTFKIMIVTRLTFDRTVLCLQNGNQKHGILTFEWLLAERHWTDWHFQKLHCSSKARHQFNAVKILLKNILYFRY